MTRTRALTGLTVAASAVAALLAGPAPMAAARPSPGPGPSALDPDLVPVLDSLAPDETTTVLVTLADGLDPKVPPGLDRRQRTAAVVARLKQQSRASQTSLTARLDDLGRRGQVSSQVPLWVTNAIAVTATAAAVREIASRTDVASVEPDSVAVTLDSAPPEPGISATGAPALWANGSTGQGVVVAVLDTGVDLSHPDLATRWRGGTNSWFDPYGQHASPVDLVGHGTAAAGTVLGGDDTRAYGMAPGASWIAARLFDDRGSSKASSMHQAFQWVLDPDGNPATDDVPDVVNGSWVLGAGPSCTLSFQPDVQALRAAGVLPVFAAGNFGPGAGTSASPGNYPESVSVGAVDAGDALWPYTSAGPSTCGGRSRAFPDLVAPGVSVTSADLYGGFQALTGTSVAAPHVAGALALLEGAHPGSSPDAVVSALVSTAVDLGTPGPDESYGNGRIDVVAADAALSSAPAPPGFSLTAPASVTVSRGGSATLAVAVSVTSGAPGPVTLSVSGIPKGVGATWTTNPVSVPGGSDLVLTVPTKVKRGTYGVALTASGGGVVSTVAVDLVVR